MLIKEQLVAAHTKLFWTDGDQNIVDGLTKVQSLALVNKIASGEDIKLRKLNIGYSNLSHISPELLSEVVLRLEDIDLCAT